MYITNNQKVAQIADKNGVDWIFIDLETIDKELRQPNMDTVKSNHSIKDIIEIKKVISNSKLLVRINSIYEGSVNEINQVLSAGADIIMLPYFKTIDEVKFFIDSVGNGAEKCLLLETPEAVEIIDEILDIDGVDYIHIGLNDLHLGYHRKFMFQLLSDGTVDNIISKIKKKNIIYGFGGIAKLGEGILPAELILHEHYRLNSQLVILSRTFYRFNENDSYDKIDEIFRKGLKSLRDYEKIVKMKENKFFQDSHIKLNSIVKNITEGME